VISAVEFRRFKALRHARVALQPFNLVIGPNGSGKTSLIEAIQRLRVLAALPVADDAAPPSRVGGPEIDFSFDTPDNGILVRLSCVAETTCDLLRVFPSGAPGWAALRERLRGMRGYMLDHAVIGRSAPIVETAVVRSDGSNLAAVLLGWRERAPAVFAEFSAEVLRILPEFSAVELREDAGRVELALRLEGEGILPVHELSQGTLYLVALLALAFDPNPPAVMCLEEVDRGMHPRTLREVRDALYRLSYPAAFGMKRGPVQIIATTHSPYLIDLFRDHPEEVVIAQKQGRAAHFERLSDRADLPELLANGSLGDMWYSGILGGVPEER
jgi:predicted ATPase